MKIAGSKSHHRAIAGPFGSQAPGEMFGKQCLHLSWFVDGHGSSCVPTGFVQGGLHQVVTCIGSFPLNLVEPTKPTNDNKWMLVSHGYTMVHLATWVKTYQKYIQVGCFISGLSWIDRFEITNHGAGK